MSHSYHFHFPTLFIGRHQDVAQKGCFYNKQSFFFFGGGVVGIPLFVILALLITVSIESSMFVDEL